MPPNKALKLAAVLTNLSSLGRGGADPISNLAGVFVFECGGVLAGIEVYGLARDNPRDLPEPGSLRPFEQG